MSTEISTLAPDKIVAPHAQEVEFALLLAQMISTVQQDPEQLRLTIYDFARAKLKNDLAWADEEERKRLLASLETAIRGVEDFSQRPEPVRRISAYGSSGAPRTDSEPLRWIGEETKPAAPLREGGFGTGSTAAVRQRRGRWVLAATVVLAIGLAGLAFGVHRYKSDLRFASLSAAETKSTAAVSTVASPNAPPPAAPAQPAFPLPAVYGVYALNDGKLSELDTLTAQVPDRRVAMSTPISTPSHTVLPDGSSKFIVFRRDIAASAPERVDVRVVAQVRREIAFDAKGNRSITSVSDAWSIRNIFRSFRVRPIPGNPEMLLIQSEKDGAVLSPGRYALALNSQAYDFTVAGQVNDVAQCLERTNAANGTFYSECQQLP